MVTDIATGLGYSLGILFPMYVLLRLLNIKMRQGLKLGLMWWVGMGITFSFSPGIGLFILSFLGLAEDATLEQNE